MNSHVNSVITHIMRFFELACYSLCYDVWETINCVGRNAGRMHAVACELRQEPFGYFGMGLFMSWVEVGWNSELHVESVGVRDMSGMRRFRMIGLGRVFMGKNLHNFIRASLVCFSIFVLF